MKSWRASSPTGRRPPSSSACAPPTTPNFVRGVERIDGFGGKSSILAESQVYGDSPDFYKTRLGWVGSATAAERAGRGETLAVRRRVRAERRSHADVQDGRLQRRSQQGAGYRRSAVVESAAAAAREIVQWAAVGGRRAAQRARRRPHADRRCRLRGGQPGQARHGAPHHADARRKAPRPVPRPRFPIVWSPSAQPSASANSLDRSYLDMNALSARLDESLELYGDVLSIRRFPRRSSSVCAARLWPPSSRRRRSRRPSSIACGPSCCSVRATPTRILLRARAPRKP